MMTAVTITSANSVHAIMQPVIVPFIIELSIICGIAIPFAKLFFIWRVIPRFSRAHPHHAAAADDHQYNKRNQ